MTGAELLAAVKSQGAFDASSGNVSDVTVLSWVNARYRELCVQAKWLKAVVELGPTVAGVATYVLPDNVSEITALQIGGAGEATRLKAEELWTLKAGNGSLDGWPRQAYAPTFSTDGSQQQVEVWPAPAEAGVAVQALAVLVPADLTLEASPVVPRDFQDAIVDGAIGLGYLRSDGRADLAAPFEAKFDVAVQRLRRRATTRVGQGPVQIRVVGRNA